MAVPLVVADPARKLGAARSPVWRHLGLNSAVRGARVISTTAHIDQGSANTKAYRTDWAEFTSWAEHHRLATLPAAPLTVACYIVELATVAKTSTIADRLP